MIGATVAMAAAAALFVLFGVLRLADRRRCEGSCAGCGVECDNRIDGRTS
jgi:hypothetical protein